MNTNAIIADLWSVFGSEPFEYANGGFEKTRELDAGTLGWPRKYLHTFRVVAHQATRESLIRRGFIEAVPSHHSGTVYRLTKGACETHANDIRSEAPAFQAWQARHETERAGYKNYISLSEKP